MADASVSNGRIRDARGRVVSQLDPVVLQVKHQYAVVDAEALDAIIEELEPGKAKVYRRLLIVVFAFFAAMAALVLILYLLMDRSGRRDLVSTLLNPAIMTPTLVGGFIVPWLSAKQARFGHVRAAMLRHRRCPHCGYDLRGLPASDRDGAVVCPECGCAWRIDDAAITRDLAAVSTMAEPARRRALVAVAVGLVVLFAAGLAFFVAFSIR